ncbi:MAG TPA: hypothetical protein VKA21_01185 [Candidatus Binatia bacterium]|nr:hypothetical protein [Candidatus Binatia bacterium]
MRTTARLALALAFVLHATSSHAGTACTDTDGDGVCDTDDACATADLFALKEPRLTVRGLTTPPGDDALRLSAEVVVPSALPIDPLAHGVRLALHEFFGERLADVTIPGGPGWRPAGVGAWYYRDPSGRAGGVTHVTVRSVVPAPALVFPRLGRFLVLIVARRGAFPIPPQAPLLVTISLDAEERLGSSCGSIVFTPEIPWTCVAAGTGHTIRCRGPKPVGPCRVGDPNDLVVCDVRNAAAAEEAYFTAYREYLPGSCTELPGFVGSPGVTCSVATMTGPDGTPAFTAVTSHPAARYQACWFVSSADEPLSCS